MYDLARYSTVLRDITRVAVCRDAGKAGRSHDENLARGGPARPSGCVDHDQVHAVQLRRLRHARADGWSRGWAAEPRRLRQARRQKGLCFGFCVLCFVFCVLCFFFALFCFVYIFVFRVCAASYHIGVLPFARRGKLLRLRGPCAPYTRYSRRPGIDCPTARPSIPPPPPTHTHTHPSLPPSPSQVRGIVPGVREDGEF